MKNIIISVESRKGGVGKTTAALCMGKTLLESGYAVLLIDTDITGTNIADCVDSPFWHNSLNILKATEGENGVRANLLSLFEDDFMNGNKLPSFRVNGKDNGFYADLNRINIIGSQIYAPDGKPTTICKPAVLFDQLHGYWFVDFLKELIEDFATATSDKPVAVVLDNSPGYVGIAPAIQDWLTDLGPETGKFLMVTSLDSQDMQSCAMAISVLHEQYKEKWDTSRMFSKAQNGNGNNLDYSLMKGDFFVKLTEQAESVSNATSKFSAPFVFYNDSSDESNNEPKESYSEYPEKYLGVIVNRVPKTVIKHRRTYTPEFAMKENLNDSPFLNLLGGHYSRQWSKYMVGYDPYIEFQFLQSGMSKRRYRRKWHRNFERMLILNEEQFSDKFLDHKSDFMSSKTFSRFNKSVNQYQNLIDIAMDEMRSNGLEHLTGLIDEDWQPKSIIANFQAAFYDLISNLDSPYFKEIYSEEFEDERIIQKNQLNRLNILMHELKIPYRYLEDYPEFGNFIFYLIGSLPIPLDRERPFDKDFIILFRELIDVEMAALEDTKENYHDWPRILSSDFMNKNTMKETLEKSHFSRRFFHRSENEFVSFFHAFTSAQARLMMLPEDSRFLIWLIQTMVEFESEKPNALPYVRKIAEDVILHKTLTYNAVKEKSSNALSQAQYFVDFDKVIKNIVRRWGIVK